jgi:hypothetical protein
VTVADTLNLTMDKTVDVTPVIHPLSYSKHTQVIKEFTEQCTRLSKACDKLEGEGGVYADAAIELADYVTSQIGALRGAVADLLGDEFLLMLNNLRRPGESYIDALNRKPMKEDY